MAAKYTEADRVAAKKALDDLEQGRRVQQVTIGGKTVQYAAAAVSVTQPILKAKLAEIEDYLDAQSGRRSRRSRRAITSKGL